jgi:hypothetical protein
LIEWLTHGFDYFACLDERPFATVFRFAGNRFSCSKHSSGLYKEGQKAGNWVYFGTEPEVYIRKEVHKDGEKISEESLEQLLQSLVVCHWMAILWRKLCPQAPVQLEII